MNRFIELNQLGKCGPIFVNVNEIVYVIKGSDGNAEVGFCKAALKAIVVKESYEEVKALIKEQAKSASVLDLDMSASSCQSGPGGPHEHFSA